MSPTGTGERSATVQTLADARELLADAKREAMDDLAYDAGADCEDLVLPTELAVRVEVEAEPEEGDDA